MVHLSVYHPNHTGEWAKAAGMWFGQVFLWTHEFQLVSFKKANVLYVIEILVRGKKCFKNSSKNSSVLTISSLSVCL